MKYRGKYIEEDVTNEIKTFEFGLTGENYGELILTKERFEKFVINFMKYRGKYIEEDVTNEIKTFEFGLTGENYGELILTKERFEKFVDKLSELRCRIDNETSDKRRIDVMLEVHEGYTSTLGVINEFDKDYSMDVYTIETVPETPEQKKLRIEKEKKEIDEDIERNRTAIEKRNKKINDAKNFSKVKVSK